MSFNIDEQRIKLIQVINDDTLNYNCLEGNSTTFLNHKPHTRFLWTVLTLTIKYPQVELYLKNLLNYFTVDELEEISNKWSILHQMVWHPHKISVNAFETIINHGVNINIQTSKGNTAAHILLHWEKCNSHNNSILNLLIKYGVDLNIRNKDNRTVLDVMTHFQVNLNEETKNCIMMFVDFGVKTCNPKKNMILDFIEYYNNLGIKPAIKNEK